MRRVQKGLKPPEVTAVRIYTIKDSTIYSRYNTKYIIQKERRSTTG